MTLSWKRVTQRLSLSLTALLLIILLAACGSLSGTASSATPTATPSPRPTATPSPTPSPTPAGTMYTGNGYTISYPVDWKKSVAANEVSFQDALGANALGVIVVANPEGASQPGTVLDASLTGSVKGANMTNTSPANVPASVSLSGETWEQKGTTGTVTQGGASTPYEIVILATNHPANSANTQLFELVYAGPMVGSTQIDAQIFQAMLASFKFTS